MRDINEHPGSRTHIDAGLAATRTRLLDDIGALDLDRVRGRAASLRRRRAAVGAAALLVLVATGGVLVRPWAGDAPPDPPAGRPEPTESSVLVFTDRGITVNGLIEDQKVTELPGDVRDVEFVDADRGWALVADCAFATRLCRLTVAKTGDGGRTWTSHEVAGGDADPAQIPDLVAFGASTVLLHGARRSMISTDAGASWREASAPQYGTPVGTSPIATSIGPDARPLLRPAGTASCAGGVVEVWSRGYGYRGDLANQPPLRACWVAAQPSADGRWWVGGTLPASGKPAVAVTRDGGASWQVTEFDPPGNSVRVATLGEQAYAVVMTDDAAGTQLAAIYHSAGRDAPFTLSRRAGKDGPNTIGGEPVPLLDGRLLVVDTGDRWYLSDDHGRTFAESERLPMASRLWRTPGGYLAFNIVASGWVAFSSDGATWRKLHVH